MKIIFCLSLNFHIEMNVNLKSSNFSPERSFAASLADLISESFLVNSVPKTGSIFPFKFSQQLAIS